MSQGPEAFRPIPFDKLWLISKMKLNMTKDEFWKCTFAEWYPIYNSVFGKVIKPLSRAELEDLESRWTSGNN